MKINSFGYKYKLQHFFNNIFSFRFLVLISPVFVITIRHWISLILIIISIGAFQFLLKSDIKYYLNTSSNKWKLYILLIFIFPFLSILISQILRLEIHFANFDAPLRLFLCSFIFTAISKGWLSSKHQEPISFSLVKYSLPLTIICTFLYRPSWTDLHGDKVITTYFVDVLTFGSINLLLTLITIFTLTIFYKKISLAIFYVYCIIIFTGFYLSTASNTRSGWIGLPFILLIWYCFFGIVELGRMKSLTIIIIIFSICSYYIFNNDILYSKIIIGYYQLVNYNWNSLSDEGSADVRISLFRMAWFYFINRPILGWGDLGWLSLINAPELVSFSSFTARMIAINGFHNEILTNSVRSGIWGLISSIWFYLIPILWFIKIYKISNNIKYISLFQLILTLHLFFTGLTTEVTNLIFLSSFYGLLMSIFLGESFYFYNKIINNNLD
jgi:O-antigen ligase